MEVTRELRTERVSKKKGTAPIQLSFCWDGLRLRLSSGESCRPADWHERQGKVKDKPGAYAAAINQVLDRWETAAVDAHQQARHDGERWDKPQMEAEIRVRYLRLLAESRGKDPGQVPTAQTLVLRKLTLLEHMDRWIDYQATKISLRSGKPLSKTYVNRLRKLRQELADFSQRYSYPLSFESMNASFYALYQDHQLRTLGNKINTFGGYIKSIKNFLYWCEEHELPVTPKFHHFETPEVYVGVEALTQAELLAWAAVDFDSPPVQAYLAEHFPYVPRPSRAGRPAVLPEDHRLRIEQARDKILQCCYFGLRISDANRLAPHHLAGDLVRIAAGKTGLLCRIPYFDDDVFKPVALVQKYAPLGLPTCLPDVPRPDEYLPHICRLAGIHRLKVTSRIGRKTFATLKIYQGVPKAQVMLATGHTTEKSFNRYLGIDEDELIDIYRRTARRVA